MKCEKHNYKPWAYDECPVCLVDQRNGLVDLISEFLATVGLYRDNYVGGVLRLRMEEAINGKHIRQGTLQDVPPVRR